MIDSFVCSGPSMKGVFMKFSRSVGYGLLSTAYIAQHGKELTTGQEISEHYNIPVEYLLKILQQLVHAGILRSKRGPRGGFVLAGSPENVTFLQIFEAIEGPAQMDLCISNHTTKEKRAILMELVCKSAIEAAEIILRKAKIADILK
jgi:Rrf2 family protein